MAIKRNKVLIYVTPWLNVTNLINCINLINLAVNEKSVTNDYILYDSIYIKCAKWENI